MHLSRHTRALAALVLAGTLGLAACGDDDDTPAAAGDTTTTEAAEGPSTDGEGTADTGSDAVEVTGIDYAFEGIDDTVEAGTEFTFINGSDKEAHELVLVHLKDGAPSLAELLELSDEEVGAAVGMPVAVAVAAQPGSEGQLVLGDALKVEEPGRYAAICNLAVGNKPDDVEKQHGPVAVPIGSRHADKGMAVEFTVE